MIKWLERIQLSVGVLFLCLFFIAILIQIATRYMGIPVIWTEEVANYSFIWAIFMGAAVMVNKREHFSFDFLSAKLTGKKKTSLMIIIDAVILGFSFFVAFYGYEAVSTFWSYNWMSLPDLKMGYIWIAIPVMGLTMMIYSLNHIVQHVKSFGKKVEA